MKKLTALVLILLLTGCAQGTDAGDRRPASSVQETSSVISQALSEPSILPFSSQPSSQTPSSSAPSSVSPSSSAPVSSAPASSAPVSSQVSMYVEQNGVKYYNVTLASKGVAMQSDNDIFFPEGEEGYYIEKGTYNVTADTFNRLVNSKMIGGGAIRFQDWVTNNYPANPNYMFDGVLPISKMNDPLYVTMCSPNECSNYYSSMGYRNGDTGVQPQQKHQKIISIGALYLNEGCTLPDDTPVTFCFSNITLAAKYKGGDWFMVNDVDMIDRLNCLYALPWQLEYDENPVHRNVIPKSKIKKVGDHVEVSLTVGDFRRKANEDSRVVGRVLHFWGQNYLLANDGKTGADIEGLAAGYQIWVKEENMSGVFSSDVGVDLRDSADAVGQAFATKSFAVTSQRRNVYGHNVTQATYDSVMDSNKVQQILKIK